MRKTSIVVLVIAAAGLLSIIGLTGLVTVRRANAINEEIVVIYATFHQSERHLQALRADLDATRIYVRDYMLDPRSEAADLTGSRFESLKSSIDSHIADLSQTLGPREAASIEELRSELKGYFDFLLSVPAAGAAGFPEGTSAIRRQLRSRREALDSLASDVAEIDERQFERGNAEIESARRDLSTYIRRMTLAGLALGLLIVVLGGQRIRALQRRDLLHRERMKRTEAELRKLSADLVQAHENERKSISRELHDEVGQTLTALGIEIRNIHRLRHEEDRAFDEHIAEARRLVQDTLKTVRDLAMGLRPPMLDDSGLVPALRWQVRDYSKRTGVPVDLQIDGSLDGLRENISTCIYRVVQEALTNCARHAGASNIRVALHGMAEGISLAVQDDGIGFDSSRTAGIGLVGIEERIRDLGGDVRIISKPQHGTLLLAEIPRETAS